MTVEKKPPFGVLDGAGESTGPRPASMRAAARELNLPPLDFDNPPPELEPDAQWLWRALGRQLVERGYLAELHVPIFFGLCSLYARQRAEPDLASVFVDYLRDCGATLEMVRQLESTRELT